MRKRDELEHLRRRVSAGDVGAAVRLLRSPDRARIAAAFIAEATDDELVGLILEAARRLGPAELDRRQRLLCEVAEALAAGGPGATGRRTPS